MSAFTRGAWPSEGGMLSLQGTLFFNTVTAILVHLVFKKTETNRPSYIASLLLGVPAICTMLYLPHANNFLTAFGMTYSLFLGTLVTSIVGYRLSPWHPLAQYPGPILWRISMFFAAVNAQRNKQYLDMQRLHEIYGDYVRIGPNELHIRDPDAVIPIIGSNGLAKGPHWEGRVPLYSPSRPLIAVREVKEHHRRRQPWQRAFTPTAVKEYEPFVVRLANQLVDTLAAESGPLDLSKWITYFAFDVMTNLAFSQKSSMLRDGDITGVLHLLEASQKGASFVHHVPWLGRFLLEVPNPWIVKRMKAFRMYTMRCAAERKANGSDYKDMFYYLIDEGNLAADKLSPPELISDGGLAVLAGSHTTATALTNLLYFIMTNPTQYQRLQTEIDGLNGETGDANKLAHLPYLNAVINEVLRLLPPTPVISQRAVDPGSGGRMLGSHFIPEGTNVSVSGYALYRDPRLFRPLPNQFLPERWLPEQERVTLEPKIFGENDFALNTTAFAPFSLGPAGCVGKPLALLELRIAIATLLHHFDFGFAPDYDHQQWYDELRDYALLMRTALPVVIRPRKRVA